MSDIFKSAQDILIKEGWSQMEVKELAEELFQVEISVKSAMDKGLTPEEMQAARGLAQAASSARQAVSELTK